jgi:6-phosphogluconolactonase (cycloisomerase 2 family)
MKFTKFGKALLMSALSVGVVLSVTSCVESYSVGYLYVTGTETSATADNGVISGFKINHNSGFLTPINGMPVSTGGANPVRAVLGLGQRFVYVLNRGVNSAGNGNCTTSNPCLNPNITEFTVGANGILTAQETFNTQGLNPFRLVTDPTGSFLYVLDHDSPANSSPSKGDPCNLALGNDPTTNLPITTCGDITVFQINQTTGRLNLVQNSQVTVSGGAELTYFPVPANPVDFAFSGSFLYTMTANATSASNSYPYTGGAISFPYTYNSSTGLLTLVQNTSTSLNILGGTAIVNTSSSIYVLDYEPSKNLNEIVPFSAGSNGALQPQSSGPILDDPNQSNPIFLVQENKGKWFYVANQGNTAQQTLPLSGIAGYVINSPFQPTEMGGAPIGFGAGSSPQCLVEDPSNQFFYTANEFSSNVTAQQLNEQSGTLTPLSNTTNVPDQYALTGQPTWCFVDGRVG